MVINPICNLSLHSRALFVHCNDVIMSAMASQITSLTSVYSTIYLGADQWKHQSSASLAFVWGIHRWSVNSLHKRPVTRKMFLFDDVIMEAVYGVLSPARTRFENFLLIKKYHRFLCKNAAGMPAQLMIDTIMLTSNLAASILRQIWCAVRNLTA